MSARFGTVSSVGLADTATPCVLKQMNPLQQLAVDSRGAPETVFQRHTLNEASKLGFDRWSSRPPPCAMPQPSESFTPPTGNRGRVDQHEPVLPAGPPPAQAHPEKTVRRTETSIRPAEYGQLMGQRHHLKEEVSTCGHRGEERRDRERVAHGR